MWELCTYVALKIYFTLIALGPWVGRRTVEFFFFALIARCFLFSFLFFTRKTLKAALDYYLYHLHSFVGQENLRVLNLGFNDLTDACLVHLKGGFYSSCGSDWNCCSFSFNFMLEMVWTIKHISFRTLIINLGGRSSSSWYAHRYVTAFCHSWFHLLTIDV